MFIITIKYLRRSILLAVSSFSFSTAMAAEKPEFNNSIFTATAAEQCEFNKHLLNKQIRESHFQSINVSYYKSIRDIPTLKREISKYIQYAPNFDQYIDEIMENIVGRKMLRLLIANMQENEPTSLCIEAGAKDEFDEMKITINLDDYNETGITKKPLCGINIGGQLVEKYDSVEDTIFHEFCHALHRYSKREQNECKLLDKIYEFRQEKYLWTYNKSENPDECEDDEELYNLTGYFDGGFDPINCNMYDIYKCVINKKPIIQRVFHVDYEQLQQEIRNKTRFNPLYKINKFLINLDDYIRFIPVLPQIQSMQPAQTARSTKHASVLSTKWKKPKRTTKPNRRTPAASLQKRSGPKKQISIPLASQYGPPIVKPAPAKK